MADAAAAAVGSVACGLIVGGNGCLRCAVYRGTHEPSVGVGEHVDGESGIGWHQVGLGFILDHLAGRADRRVHAAE
jgi:hypothetical protein